MTVLSKLSATSPFSLTSKPSAEGRFDSSAQTTAKTGSSAGDPVYATFQPSMGSNDQRSPTASAIETRREINQAFMGTRVKQTQESDSPLTAATAVQAADSPSYPDNLGVNIESNTPPGASPTANPLSAMAATAIRAQPSQPMDIDQRLRQESNDASGTPSYFRGDGVSGERGADQTVSEMVASTASIQPRQAEGTLAQPIRDIATAETAAVTTYADILSQQKQGLSAQANQNPLQVVKLLK